MKVAASKSAIKADERQIRHFVRRSNVRADEPVGCWRVTHADAQVETAGRRSRIWIEGPTRKRDSVCSVMRNVRRVVTPATTVDFPLIAMVSSETVACPECRLIVDKGAVPGTQSPLERFAALRACSNSAARIRQRVKPGRPALASKKRA